MVLGDRRKYAAALIVPESPRSSAACAISGERRASRGPSAAESAELVERPTSGPVSEIIDALNRERPNSSASEDRDPAARVSIDSGELTPYSK